MIVEIPGLPENMVGFTATGEVTEVDFKNVVIPRVQQLVDKTGELNYLLQLDTSVKNFTMGAWFQDALLGIKNITKWNRSAIITESESIKAFTDFFSMMMPGEFKTFPHSGMQIAVDWVSGKIEVE